MRTQWQWIERYAEQFRACEVGAGDVAVVLSETTSRPLIVETARLALEQLGASVIDIVVSTPPNPGPLPIRSTGASQALAGNPAVLGALAASTFVADCTVEGLLHARELGAILDSGTRVLMISNEHPENVERWPHDPSLRGVVDLAAEQMRSSEVMTVTSTAGTDLRVDLTGAFVAGS
jgi:2,5-dihydroxypyridine 5,6-dioxygenase